MWKAFQIFHGLCGFSFQNVQRPGARARGGRLRAGPLRR